MPATLEAQEFQEELEITSELKGLIDESNTSLKLKNLSTYVTTSFYCDISTR
jgi:hypothetical protein